MNNQNQKQLLTDIQWTLLDKSDARQLKHHPFIEQFTQQGVPLDLFCITYHEGKLVCFIDAQIKVQAVSMNPNGNNPVPVPPPAVPDGAMIGILLDSNQFAFPSMPKNSMYKVRLKDILGDEKESKIILT